MIESDLIADTSTTQSLEPAGYPAGWTRFFKEDFTYGYHQGFSAIHYTSTMNRVGVVRIAGGEGGCPTLRSNPVSLKNISSTRIRVGFSFYAIGMEHSDYFCIQCEIDETITGETSSFDNGRWYNGISIEFEASNANNLRIAFMIVGDGKEDGVLIDSVTIQGNA
eukprot:CAMPEP_0183717422 /NCGR_PEP_ID=MMETSP0737-20130205/11043_1 /TAXON_ID=385413 /ORGANISM="Thalassiosira miniscula, Strain CCMP1093" /LENGTH=164 /DNA_ID=CAMNT_0025946865 /DNA_START=1 /DNA_END=496 /DNA_ORIENTATION=+